MMICAGNLCRSPFAHVYMQQRLEKAHMEMGVDIFSRGLLALPGQKPPHEALQAAAELGVDISDHVSQPMLAPDIERAGLILVMGPAQRKHILKARPDSIGRVFLLSHVSPAPLTDQPVDDPMGKDKDSYLRVYAEIMRHVDAWINRFGIKL